MIIKNQNNLISKYNIKDLILQLKKNIQNQKQKINFRIKNNNKKSQKND